MPSTRPQRQSQLPFGRRHNSPAPSIASTVESSILSDLQSDIFEDEGLASAINSTPQRSATPQSRIATPTVGTISRRSNKDVRHSWVFKHMPDKDINTRYFNGEGFEIWKCHYCPKMYRVSGGTTIVSKHLLETHNIPDNSPRGIEAKRKQLSLEQAEQIAKENPQKRRKLNAGNRDSIDPDVFEVLYTKFISACHLPLRLVECPEFRDVLLHLNSEIDVWLPKTHDTIKEWVLRQFNFQKGIIRLQLQKARSIIHISCDLWTAPGAKSVFGIIAHYVSEDGQLRRHLLAMKEMPAHHTSEDEAPYVLKVLKDYGIVNKLGFFVMDNDATNDKMLRVLSLGKLVFSEGCLYY